ncbi:MAG TPA: AAA family ATPase [Candidatus Methanomethylia archaeon]|nr:AAA family ATPase [Candidatus Methanomethylicia archaeon]
MTEYEQRFGVEDKEALREQLRRLEHRVVVLEEARRLWEAERERLLEEIRRLRRELDSLSAPPLVEACVTDLLPDGRVVVKSSTGPSLVVPVAPTVPAEKLSVGARVALSQKGFAVVEILPDTVDLYVKAMEVTEAPEVAYSDIGGLEPQIQEIRELVELPLKESKLFEKVGIDPPKGVLLYGPPGCGKTLLAKAVAHETKATFIRVVGSELVQKFIGEGARLVREIFALARRKAPSIVFIDELDAIGGRRLDVATSGEREVHRTLMQLLSEMDGFNPRGDVKIIGATNRIDILDPALLRPGRFDRVIEVPLPDEMGRKEIFKIHMRRMSFSEEVDISLLAKLTEGASGADIKAICTEAGMCAIRERREHVEMRDFLKAIDKVLSKRSKTTEKTSTYI